MYVRSYLSISNNGPELFIRRRQLRSPGRVFDGSPGRHGLVSDYFTNQKTHPHLVGFPAGRSPAGGSAVCCFDQELLHFGPIRRVLMVSIPLLYTHELQWLL
jgi:hypothetical protein